MVALWGGLATGAMASNTREAVACVQALLTQAGHDAGPADGKIGPRTQRALAAWAKAQRSRTNVVLKPSSAAHLCLRLGMQVEGGRALWPALRDLPVSGYRRWADVAVSSELAAGQDAAILARLDEIYMQITRQLGVQTAGVDQVVLAVSAAELQRMVTARINYQIEGLRANLTDRCGKDHEISAAAAPGIAYFCLREPGHLSLDHPQRRLRFVMAHEVMHLVHFQVAGPIPPDDARKGNRPARVPIWFIEGLAEVMGYRVTWPADPDGMLRRMRARYQAKPVPDLRKLEKFAALSRHENDVYHAGALATGLMVEARGTAALGRVLLAMGAGASFAAAYEAEFGESLDSFYRAFATRVRMIKPPQGNTAGASTSGTVAPARRAAPAGNTSQDL